ncbi:unnamed protein product, partial [Meganyctiphanes norvegica]
MLECVVCKERTWGIEALQCAICERWTHNDHSQSALHRFYTAKYGPSQIYNCRDCTSQLMSEMDSNESVATTHSSTVPSVININNTPFVISHTSRKNRAPDLSYQESSHDLSSKYLDSKEKSGVIDSNNTNLSKAVEIDNIKNVLSKNDKQVVYPNYLNQLSDGNYNSKSSRGILNTTHIRRKQRRSPPYLPSWSDIPKIVPKSESQKPSLNYDSIFDKAIKQTLNLPPVAIEYVHQEVDINQFQSISKLDNKINESYHCEIDQHIEKKFKESNTDLSFNFVEYHADTQNDLNKSEISEIDISNILGIPGPVYIKEYSAPCTKKNPQKIKKNESGVCEVDGLYQMMNSLGVEIDSAINYDKKSSHFQN